MADPRPDPPRRWPGPTGEAIDKEQIKDEAKLAPKDGEKLKVGDKELTWKKVTAEEYYFDVNKLLGAETERSMAYAVTYVVAADDIKAVLKIRERRRVQSVRERERSR